VKLNDYIRGDRHGEAAHELELDAMRDPLLADALDGYNAVPGDHSAVLAGLAGRIRHSATGGRASARSRASRQFERRVRVWSVALAAAIAGGAIAGGVWLFGSDVPVSNNRAEHRNAVPTAQVETYLPAVSVVKTPTPPTEADAARLGRDEIRHIPAASTDTVTTAAFRRHVSAHGAAIGRADAGVGTLLTFRVSANGRPENIEVAGSTSPEALAAAVELLTGGPHWPAEQRVKTIILIK